MSRLKGILTIDLRQVLLVILIQIPNLDHLLNLLQWRMSVKNLQIIRVTKLLLDRIVPMFTRVILIQATIMKTKLHKLVSIALE
ncbi:hypothetical protein CERZMDRAFT_108126 [Cercospora zeae-maydis SCOH1-5]|uniref:Uncharacterized protein n=1 Tax=Cercospora zeae-maydis SCOH1-5 TaxID=717836 RepID=A0A6A6EWM7_9PEZI|nr:hypothetical protein CERZMDRAFT_108126 [Cercospora zeae-maydis SCOH1-5]